MQFDGSGSYDPDGSIQAYLRARGFTITATDEENSIRTQTITGNYVLASPPQVTVSAFVDDRPPIRFTVTCVAQPEGVLQDIKLYINDQMVKTWTQAGTYTYDWVPITTDLQPIMLQQAQLPV